MTAVAQRLRDWAWSERGHFGAWLPVFIGIGALAYFVWPSEPDPVATAASVSGALALFALLHRSFAGRACGAALAAMAIGFACGQIATLRAPPVATLPMKALLVTGRVTSVEALPDGARRLTIAAPHIALAPRRGEALAPRSGGEGAAPDPGQTIARSVRIKLRRDDEATPVAGDEVRIRALLRAPSAPAFPGARDGRFEAFFSGLAASGYALNPLERLDHHDADDALGRIDAWREEIAARLIETLGPDAGPIAAAMLVGESRAITSADRESFADAGLSHLLAVAGLHMGIVMGLFLGLSRFLLLRSEALALRVSVRTVSALVALAAGGAYLLMTGAHVPIVRSFAMASLFTAGLVLGRRSVSLRGWAVAATAILLVSPQQVLGVSFQMSFAAVLALIAGYEVLRGPLARLRGDGTRWRRFGHHCALLALTSLFAGSASAPFASYHFGHLQPWFILANMLAVPVTALWVMPLGFLGLALMPLGLGWLALVPMAWGIEATRWMAQMVAALPAARIAVPQGPGWGLVLVALGLAWLCLWRTRWRVAGIVPLLVGLCAPALVARADLLVSGDGRLIGVHDAGAMLLRRHGGTQRYLADQFAQYWAAGEEAAPASGGGLVCGEDGRCRIGDVLLLRGDEQEAVPDEECAGVRLVVSAAPARDACAGVGLVDRFTVWREGPAAIWLRPDGPVVVTDGAARGDRPWTRRRTAKPMAEAE